MYTFHLFAENNGVFKRSNYYLFTTACSISIIEFLYLVSFTFPFLRYLPPEYSISSKLTLSIGCIIVFLNILFLKKNEVKITGNVQTKYLTNKNHALFSRPVLLRDIFVVTPFILLPISALLLA